MHNKSFEEFGTENPEVKKAVFVMIGKKDFLTGGYDFNFRMAEYLDQQGIELDVIHRRTIPENIRDSVFRTSFYVLGRVLRKRPDILIISKSYLYVLLLRFWLMFSGVSLLYLVHHFDWRDRLEDKGSILRKGIVRWLLRRADRIWTNSRSTANDISRLGISRANISVISPGFVRDDISLPEKKQSSGPVKLLNIGSISPRKAQSILIEACSKLGDRQYILNIVGDDLTEPAYAATVRELIKRSCLNDRITLNGRVEQEELARFYRDADILVHPSLWEGYGIVIADAMWHGLPVIASNAGALPELVKDTINGFLVPPGNPEALAEKLIELIDAPGLRLSMGLESRKIASALNDWNDTSIKFLDLVRRTARKETRS